MVAQSHCIVEVTHESGSIWQYCIRVWATVRAGIPSRMVVIHPYRLTGTVWHAGRNSHATEAVLLQCSVSSSCDACQRWPLKPFNCRAIFFPLQLVPAEAMAKLLVSMLLLAVHPASADVEQALASDALLNSQLMESSVDKSRNMNCTELQTTATWRLLCSSFWVLYYSP